MRPLGLMACFPLLLAGCAGEEEEPPPAPPATDWGPCGEPVVTVSEGSNAEGFVLDATPEIELFYDGAGFYAFGSLQVNGYAALTAELSIRRASDGVVVSADSVQEITGSPTDDECVFERAGIRMLPSAPPAGELPVGPNGLVIAEWTCDELGKEYELCMTIDDADDAYDDPISDCFAGVLVHRGTGCDIF